MSAYVVCVIWAKMPTPLRRDEELSEDQDVAIDDEDDDSLAG